jgi:hypothetical protein
MPCAPVRQDRLGVLAHRRIHRVHAVLEAAVHPAAAAPGSWARPAIDLAPAVARLQLRMRPQPAMSLTCALAICAASSRSITCSRRERAEGLDDEARSSSGSRCALGIGVEARIVGQLGLQQHLVAEQRPLALVLQAQHHGLAVAGGNGP